MGSCEYSNTLFHDVNRFVKNCGFRRKFFIGLLCGFLSTLILLPASYAENDQNTSDLATGHNLFDDYTPPSPPEPSVWQENLQKLAKDALARSQADLLVVPFQSSPNHHEFDATARSLFSLTTANTLHRSNVDIADPVLTAEALGLQKSSFKREAIESLVKTTGAKRVLINKVGHSGNNTFHVTLTLYETGSGVDAQDPEWPGFTRVASAERSGIPFNSLELPFYAYTEIHHKLLSELFDTQIAAIELKQGRSGLDANITLDDFLKNEPDHPVLTAQKLQYLGLLYPHDIIDRSGSFLYERSLVVLNEAQPSAKVDELRAVALLALNRRPAAIELLGDSPANPSAQALLNYANGNAVVGETLNSIPDMLERWSAQSRNQRLRFSYDYPHDIDINKAYSVVTQPAWQLLNQLTYIRETNFYKIDYIYIKQLLDAVVPHEEYSLQSVSERVRDKKRPFAVRQLGIETFSHIDQLMDEDNPVDLGPRLSDYAQVVRGHLTALVIEQIDRELHTRQNYSLAKDWVEFNQPLVAGQPAFQLLASKAYKSIADLDHLAGSNKASYQEKAKQLAIAGFINANTHNSLSNHASRYLYDFNSMPSLHRQRLLGNTQWPAPCQGRNSFNEDCLDYTISNFSLLEKRLKHLAATDLPKAKTFLEKNHNRFKGHSDRMELFYFTYKKMGDVDSLNRVQQEFVDGGKTDWFLTRRQANEARLELRMDEAADILLAYPEFKQRTNISHLQVSNRSYRSGSPLFWAGEHEAVSPIYKIAANGETGAASELTARARLASIAGDFKTAQENHKLRIDRYSTLFAIRDYMGMTVLLNQPDQALSWSEKYASYSHRPELWHGTLIAHRAKGSTQQQEIDWINAKFTARNFNQKKNANSYFFMMELLDRNAEEGLSEAFTTHFSQQMREVRVSKENAESWRTKPIEPTSIEDTEFRIVKHPQWAAAEVMSKAYSGDFEQAAAVINKEQLCHGNKDSKEFLWLCAWTAVHTGQEASLAQAVESDAQQISLDTIAESDPKGRLFDHYLAMAMLSGFDGQHEDALHFLHLSVADQKYTNTRSLFNRYQTLEVARLLFEATKDPQYQAFTLEYANRFAIVDPIVAYNHSFIAMVSDKAEDRISALSTLKKMDRHSRALKIASADEIEAEVKVKPKTKDKPVRLFGNDQSSTLWK